MKTGLRIFIVDDDRDFAESLGDVLEPQGHTVVLAYSGEEAVQRFETEDFDITFMDVRMPGMNGVESFFALRKMKPDAKVIMMTAHTVEHLLQQAVENGAVGVLRKPFDMDDLVKMLDVIRPEGVVLVVDDDDDFAESVEKVLTDGGYRVLVARTGDEAVEKVLANDIDLLVLDLRLPVISGFEVYLELKKRGRTVPTIIVTGYAAEESESIDALRSMSVTGCLVKPFDPAELLAVIRTHLNPTE